MLGDKFHQEVTYDELRDLVKEMIAYAKIQPFDSVKVAKEAQEIKVQGVKVDPVNEEGLLRVRGERSIDACAKYNKFIRLGHHNLQISYWEMEIPDTGRVGQLTVVDNYGFPLKNELVHGFVDLFFDYKGSWHQMNTPKHVAVVVQKA